MGTDQFTSPSGGDGMLHAAQHAQHTVHTPDAPTKADFFTVELNHSQWVVPTRYSDLQAIGSGAYGSVCSAFDTQLHRRVAIKKLTKPFLAQEYAKRSYRELRILAHMNHENLLCLVDAFSPQDSLETFSDLYLVTPFMQMNLRTVMSSNELSEEHVRYLVYQLFCALKYMHSCGLIHRDLKPENIGVNEDCELRLLDFGLARQRDEHMTGYVTTRWYRAPEVILEWEHYDQQVDIWSAACIMSELRTRKTLFPGLNYIDQIRLIISFLGTSDEEYSQKAQELTSDCGPFTPPDFNEHFSAFSKEGIDLLGKLLRIDPRRRLTAGEALDHPYFISLRDKLCESVGEPFDDPVEHLMEVSIEDWKGHIWTTLINFVPKLDSFILDDACGNGSRSR